MDYLKKIKFELFKIKRSIKERIIEKLLKDIGYVNDLNMIKKIELKLENGRIYSWGFNKKQIK